MNQSANNSIYEDVRSSPVLWLWLLAVFIIPSVLCSFFLLFHFLGKRSLRQAINNHIIIVVLILGLIYTLIDIGSSITYYRLNRMVWPKLPAFCFIWLLVDFGTYNTITVLLAWASFERHILVFHHQLMNTHSKKIIFHYIPLFFLLIYMSPFYIIVVFFYPCENYWDYTWAICGVDGCYHSNLFLSYWELYLHGIIPMMLIAVFNITLLIRVLCHKRAVHQTIVWKKHRKMAIQLLSISALYLSVNFPLFFITMLNLLGLMLNHPAFGKLSYFTNHVIMFLPFVTLGCLPEVWKKMKSILPINTIQITPFPIQPNNNF